jgi:hypothetical protein
VWYTVWNCRQVIWGSLDSAVDILQILLGFEKAWPCLESSEYVSYMQKLDDSKDRIIGILLLEAAFGSAESSYILLLSKSKIKTMGSDQTTKSTSSEVGSSPRSWSVNPKYEQASQRHRIASFWMYQIQVQIWLYGEKTFGWSRRKGRCRRPPLEWIQYHVRSTPPQTWQRSKNSKSGTKFCGFMPRILLFLQTNPHLSRTEVPWNLLYPTLRCQPGTPFLTITRFFGYQALFSSAHTPVAGSARSNLRMVCVSLESPPCVSRWIAFHLADPIGVSLAFSSAVLMLSVD